MTAPLKNLRAWTGVVIALAICGCAAVGTELRRPSGVDKLPQDARNYGVDKLPQDARNYGVDKLPQDARIGLVEFRQCGASYLDRLNPAYYGQDTKAAFLLSCTEMGYPETFHDRLRQRLEERLGKKLVPVKSDKPFMAKIVTRDAEKLGLDYVLAGDLLAMGETVTGAVVSTQLFVIRVADRKVVLQGRFKKTAARGKMQNVIDAVADELFIKTFAE